MKFPNKLQKVIELFIVLLNFVPLAIAAEIPFLIPLAGIIAALLWLDDDLQS